MGVSITLSYRLTSVKKISYCDNIPSPQHYDDETDDNNNPYHNATHPHKPALTKRISKNLHKGLNAHERQPRSQIPWTKDLKKDLYGDLKVLSIAAWNINGLNCWMRRMKNVGKR